MTGHRRSPPERGPGNSSQERSLLQYCIDAKLNLSLSLSLSLRLSLTGRRGVTVCHAGDRGPAGVSRVFIFKFKGGPAGVS